MKEVILHLGLVLDLGEVLEFFVGLIDCLIFRSKQKDLYDETFRDLVQSVLDGFNGTIFAYGQTGTGKTFTMQGKYRKVTAVFSKYLGTFTLKRCMAQLKG